MTDFKNQAKRLRTALSEDGIAVRSGRIEPDGARVQTPGQTFSARPIKVLPSRDPSCRTQSRQAAAVNRVNMAHFTTPS